MDTNANSFILFERKTGRNKSATFEENGFHRVFN